MTTLTRWREAFRQLDTACPWPGPRPMTAADGATLLIGRERDADRFSSDVQSHSLVVLSGDSGVGKSSLLNVGLLAELAEQGFLALLCNDWSGAEEGPGDPAAFILGKIASQLPPDVHAATDGPEAVWDLLDEEYGGTAVLVLDQFEELIRYQPRLFNQVVDWLIEVNQKRQIHVVLSMRSEYTHRLKRLSSSVTPFTMIRYDLEPLTDEATVAEVIRSPRSADGPPITEDAAEELLAAWRTAVSLAQFDGHIGLLHLQAALYTLHARAGGQVVTRDHVRLMEEVAGADQLFQVGLLEAVAIKLDRCTAACAAAGLPASVDGSLVTGTLAAIRQVAGRLSSGGYKVVSEEWDLARKTLARELSTLGQEDDAERLFRHLTRTAIAGDTGDPGSDLLAASRSDLLRAAGVTAADDPEDPSYLRELGVDPAPWVSDPDDHSSGPMLGLAPREVLAEELRRLVFALQWLRETSLVRSTSLSQGQRMISLVHDGFGPALDRWTAEGQQIRPAEAIGRISTTRGETFDWQDDRSDTPAHREFDGGAGFTTICNVRWQYCRVTAVFRHVVFVNCDFRGSRFESCGFRGVTFINCLLDGASFSDCRIYGAVPPATPEYAERLPSFDVPVQPEEIASMNWHRETDVPATSVYSVTSGVPAVPWDGPTDGAFAWVPASGGLIMYGGRLDSLMVRSCTFDADGTLALRHVAGSSLAVVEQSSGRIELFGSVVRGLSITVPVQQELDRTAVLTLDVRGSRLANTWFGDRLHGSATLEDCVLWQLVNLSGSPTQPDSGFDVRVRSCSYRGLVNVAPPTNSLELDRMDLDGLGDRDAVTAEALPMDYRRVPAKLELESRLQQR